MTFFTHKFSIFLLCFSFFILHSSFFISVYADDEVMPIIAYMGVPNDRNEEQYFRDFSDCGFNVSLYGYASLRQLTTACRIADRYGVKILGHCPETHDRPEFAASILKDMPGFFGYVLQDEPSAPEIRELQKEILRLKAIDDRHCFYINLHPYYDDWTLDFTETKSYDDYLNTAIATSCGQISFDYYPVTKQGLRDGWYDNLELIRRKSIQAGIPFWGFVLSVPHAVYPQPTIGSLRLQVYSNLAYGAQAIQYFTYWTPEPERENNFHNGPVNRKGKKTKTYYLVQAMNRELKTVSKLFYGARVISVRHLGRVDRGTSPLKQVPVNVRRLRVMGRSGAIVSQIEKQGHRYLVIVNKDYNSRMQVFLTMKSLVPRHLTKSLREEKPKHTYSVSPGDVLLFKLK